MRDDDKKKLNLLSKESVFKFAFIILILMTVGSLTVGVFFYKQYSELKKHPNAASEKEIQQLITAVSQHLLLPTDETPTMATIANIDDVKNQAFFAKAENGDQLLAYPKAMEAILFRPSINRIVNVASIVVDSAAPTAEAPTTSEISADLKIAYYNGTNTVGLAGEIEKQVLKAFPAYKTSALANAGVKTYSEILIIDLTGNHSAEATSLAKAINGTVSELPAGEAKPDADILIIAGK